MASNNLGGVRIADNQTSGQHRTANDALNHIDGAITDTVSIGVPSSNTFSLSPNAMFGYFRFVIGAGSTSPTAAVTVNLPSGSTAERGLTFWRNTLSYPATVQLSGQTAPVVVIPPGGAALIDFDSTDARLVNYQQPFFYTVAVSDESTALTTGTAKVTFRMPCRVWVAEVRASLNVAQTSGSTLTVDINEAGSSILSTKLTVDNTEKTSVTAATPAVISDNSLADDAEITVDIDTVGDGTAAGLKITLIGYRY